MAGVHAVAQTAEVSTGTSKKTILQILAAANHRAVVNAISISFKGTTNTDAPILVEVLKQSTAGSGGDALTCQKKNPSDDETIQTTALENIDGSTQPTDDNIVMRELVHPQGAFLEQFRFKGELHVPGGGRLGVAVTAANAVNCVARMDFEE